jgi:hypothetical protein
MRLDELNANCELRKGSKGQVRNVNRKGEIHPTFNVGLILLRGVSKLGDLMRPEVIDD